MLQNLRNKTQSWFATIIIAVIIVTFALWGVQRLFVSGSGTATVAKVGHAKITASEFTSAYQLARRHAQIQLGDKFFSTPNLSSKIKQATLTQLVHRTALQNKLHHLGFIAGPALLETNLIAIPAFQEEGKFSQQKFLQTVSAMGYTSRQFLAQLGQEIMTNQLQAGLVGSDFFLPTEANTVQGYIHQLRQFQYLTIPAEAFSTTVHLSNQRLQQYYQQHQQDFKTPAQVSVSYLELSLQDLMRTIHPTDVELKQFYQENLARFHHKSYTDVASEIKQAYVQQAAQKLFASKTSELTNLSYEHPNSLESIATAMKLPIKSTPLFAQTGNKSGILASNDFVAAAFSDNVVKQGNNSGVINLSNNAIAILHLKQHQIAAVKSFANVKPEITQRLTQQETMKLAQQLGQQLMADINSGRSIASLLAMHSLKWQQSHRFISRQDKQANPEILSTAFLLPLNRTAANGFVTKKGFVVVNLEAWKAGPNKLSAKDRHTFNQVMAHAYGNTAYDLYEQQILHDAKIKYYDKNMPAIS